MKRFSLLGSSALLLVMASLLTNCGDDSESSDNLYAFDLPAGFPSPPAKNNGPLTLEKIELGRRLFYDVRLSGNNRQSCADCHQPAHAFTDARQYSPGAEGNLITLNTIGLANAPYAGTYTWGNGGTTDFRTQMLIPLFEDNPPEMNSEEVALIQELRATSDYPELFEKAFPNFEQPLIEENLLEAIAAFEMTLISTHSPYDDYTYRGENDALSASQVRGMELFNSDQLKCAYCHGGVNFNEKRRDRQDGSVLPHLDFANTSLYPLNGFPDGRTGARAYSGDPTQEGFFKVVSLRNVELTPPYMHDGSIATLEEVIDHYAAGGRAQHPRKSDFLTGFTLTQQEKADLVAFLKSLTDLEFLCEPAFSDPFGRLPQSSLCN